MSCGGHRGWGRRGRVACGPFRGLSCSGGGERGAGAKAGGEEGESCLVGPACQWLGEEGVREAASWAAAWMLGRRARFWAGGVASGLERELGWILVRLGVLAQNRLG